MKERLVSARSLPEAYHAALRVLHEEGEVTPCPDYNTNQKELSMTIFVEEPLAEPLISKLFIGGYRELEQYRQEMLDGMTAEPQRRAVSTSSVRASRPTGFDSSKLR